MIEAKFKIDLPERLPKTNAEEARLLNIIEMAMGFASMTRVYQKNTKQKICQKCEEMIPKFGRVNSKGEFDLTHQEFCEWGVANILTTHNKPASYGQVGKTLNVILEVVIYYCHYPSYNKAAQIAPWLHAAIDI